MNNEFKTKLKNLNSASSFNSVASDDETSFNIKGMNNLNQVERKDAGNNDWDSVPTTYDKEESTHEHEKTATNNQWCSTSK